MDPWFFKSPLLRYYTAFTTQNEYEKMIVVRMHSNKIFLISLHPEHPAMKENIVSVSFKISVDGISGKKKKGAVYLQSNTRLLEICTENNTYIINAGIPGKLIETNEILATDPNYIKNKEGFLAILMPPLSKIDGILKSLKKVDNFY